MKTGQFEPCEFKAQTNAGPFRVSGSYFVCDGLPLVLHKGYGAKKGSPWMYASEYTTGIVVASGKRSQLLKRLTKIIAYHGGAEAMKARYRNHKVFSSIQGEYHLVEVLNSELSPA